ncbi:carbohydrate-binding family 9-like protein [Mucilaginibacter agri]|uniref:Carbohydrate-binding domain-containing protein n=1 Tax=Mucilaginibacter agri TaxID=2695265 RepID=A0A966DV35_9SPHI|nr:carbohydrate-binding family 9-like protein [Mucilaginibacter agri]NCD72445.1 hypothetical protein [Mucilaginibacter agri]
MVKRIVKTHLIKGLLLAIVALGATTPLKAQNAFKGLEHLFTTPKNYVVSHTDEVIKVDGNLQEAAWKKAEWTTNFVDIEGALKPLPQFDTQVKMLWNDSTLFVAAKMQEPQIWAAQKHHDDLIFHDNDFEIFVNPVNNTTEYFEIEVNAINKIFDLFLPKAYRAGGDALISWDVADLKSAVTIDGTLNNPKDKDKSWTVEMAIPLKAIRMGFNAKGPKEGDIWRINFSRVEWDTEIVGNKNVKLTDANGKALSEHNWVWSPQGIIAMHAPERWGYLQFTRKENTVFKLPYAELQKQYLWLIYYRQKEFLSKNKKYANTLEELQIDANPTINGLSNQLEMQTGGKHFTAAVKANGQNTIEINDEGFISLPNQ